MAIFGGISVGTLVAFLWCRHKHYPFAIFADAIAPALPVAQAIGRLGNWFNQELYGGPSDAPWALEIYRRVNSSGQTDNMDGISTGVVEKLVQPTFLYELLWNLLVVVLLVWADRRFRLGGGRVFMLYVAGYTFGRFFIELLRTDEATTVFGDVRINSVTSAVVFVCAAVLFVATRHRTRETPEQVAGTSGDGQPVDAEETAGEGRDPAEDSDGSGVAGPQSPDGPRAAGR